MSETIIGRPASEVLEAPAPAVASAAPVSLCPFEDWAKAKKIPDWKLAATRAFASWPAGREVTEADFDQAVQRACSVAMR